MECEYEFAAVCQGESKSEGEGEAKSKEESWRQEKATRNQKTKDSQVDQVDRIGKDAEDSGKDTAYPRTDAEICKESHSSGKQTVAEWVEDAVSTSLLFACGVDFIQGNFLQEPAKVLAEEYMPV